MFVDNLTHDGLLCVQHVRSEVEDDIQHAGLRGQCRAPMLRQRVSHDLIVQIIRAQSTEDHVDKCVADCHTATPAHID